MGRESPDMGFLIGGPIPPLFLERQINLVIAFNEGHGFVFDTFQNISSDIVSQFHRPLALVAARRVLRGRRRLPRAFFFNVGDAEIVRDQRSIENQLRLLFHRPGLYFDRYFSLGMKEVLVGNDHEIRIRRELKICRLRHRIERMHFGCRHFNDRIQSGQRRDKLEIDKNDSREQQDVENIEVHLEGSDLCRHGHVSAIISSTNR